MLSILPANDKIINDIQRQINDFIWDGKRPKINAKQMAQTYENGGLNLTYLPYLVKSLRISWISRLETSDGNWQRSVKFILSDTETTLLWSLDSKSLVQISNNIDNPFTLPRQSRRRNSTYLSKENGMKPNP